jgi:hypothetical protein
MPYKRELDERELNSSFDRGIDSALANYAEPDAGLEGRVLARIAEVRAEEEMPSLRRWLPWAIALPVAACTLLIVALLLRFAGQSPVPPVLYSHKPPAQMAPESAMVQAPQIPERRTEPRPHLVASRAASRNAQQTASKPAPLPKLDVFPTPQPLTPEEQALVHYVTNTPPSERKTLLAVQNQSDAPLSIAAIEIPPLQPLDKTDTKGN